MSAPALVTIEAVIELADGTRWIREVPKHAGWKRSVLSGWDQKARLVSSREVRKA